MNVTGSAYENKSICRSTQKGLYYFVKNNYRPKQNVIYLVDFYYCQNADALFFQGNITPHGYCTKWHNVT